MTKLKLTGATALFLLVGAGAGFAQTAVTATTDLNVRVGPGPQYPVATTLGANQSATLNGCAQGSRWCQISVKSVQGWAYSNYLRGTQQVVVSEQPADAIPVVRYEGTSAPTASVAGELVYDPGYSTGTSAVAVAPTETVTRYVTTNQVDPVYLDGEVVLGAGVPDTVTLREIPDYQYRYSTINGQPVLVEPSSRRIVYVYR